MLYFFPTHHGNILQGFDYVHALWSLLDAWLLGVGDVCLVTFKGFFQCLRTDMPERFIISVQKSCLLVPSTKKQFLFAFPSSQQCCELPKEHKYQVSCKNNHFPPLVCIFIYWASCRNKKIVVLFRFSFEARMSKWRLWKKLALIAGFHFFNKIKTFYKAFSPWRNKLWQFFSLRDPSSCLSEMTISFCHLFRLFTV